MRMLGTIVAWFVVTTGAAAASDGRNVFKITVVDAQTKRGVPLVELRTTNEIRYYTDSNGVVAFDEPGLMDQDVFFTIRSHGYEFPADGFGTRGKGLRTAPGKSATLEIRRLNIAERLYRVTGAGIFRDSVLTDTPAPTSQPLLNGKVMGQDSVQCYPYRGKLFWLWGDTGRASYPLGNFKTTAATSLLPANGGLDPSLGVNLGYFTGDDGFVRQMVPTKEEGVVWCDGLFTIADDTGAERLVTHYARLKDLGTPLEHGLLAFNESTGTFDRLAKFDMDSPTRAGWHHANRRTTDGVDYVYFGGPFYTMRVRADWASIRDQRKYEAYTCLAPGARYDKANPPLERDGAKKLVYAWKPDTGRIGAAEEAELVKSGKLQPDERRWELRDAETDKPVTPSSGSCYYNAYRKRWVAIFTQSFGSSILGEVYYAEAPDPLGPWTKARKVVTHDNYSFYNPKHHPYFDQDGGRVIYFEGTYTTFLTGNKDPTPRYDYNQIMYRLDLGDPRLESVR